MEQLRRRVLDYVGRRRRRRARRRSAEGGLWRGSGDAPRRPRRQRRRLQRCADRDDLVGVHAVQGRRAEEGLHATAHEGDAGRSPDEHSAVDRCGRKPCELEGFGRHLEGALDEGLGDGVELRLRHAETQTERRAPDAVRDVVELHLCLHIRREVDLEALGGRAEPLEGLRIGAQVEPMQLEEGVRHSLGDGAVDVVSAEERVPRRRQDFVEVARELEHRAVERPASVVVNGDPLALRAPESVRERRRRRFVQDSQHVEARHAAGHLRRRPLQLVEVGRDGDHRPADLLAQRGLGDLPDSLQDERADLGQRVAFASRDHQAALSGPFAELEGETRTREADLVRVPRPPDEALDARDRVLGVDLAPRLRSLADEDIAVRVEADDARQEPAPVLVGEDVNAATSHAGDHGVGGPQIDTDYGAHGGYHTPIQDGLGESTTRAERPCSPGPPRDPGP